MTEERQITFAATGVLDMLSDSDITGRKSLLAGAEDLDTEVAFRIVATTAVVNYDLLSGTRTVARGRVSSGGTIGVMPNEQTAVQKSFLCLAGEALVLNVDNTSGTPAVMAVIDREIIDDEFLT